MLFFPLNPNSFCSQDCGRNKGSFFLTPSHDSQERREDEERIKATILMTSKACRGGRSLHQVGLARRCRVAKKTQLFILPFWCRGSLWCRPSELIWKHFAPWLSYCRWGVMLRRVNLPPHPVTTHSTRICTSCDLHVHHWVALNRSHCLQEFRLERVCENPVYFCFSMQSHFCFPTLGDTLMGAPCSFRAAAVQRNGPPPSPAEMSHKTRSGWLQLTVVVHLFPITEAAFRLISPDCNVSLRCWLDLINDCRPDGGRTPWRSLSHTSPGN